MDDNLTSENYTDYLYEDMPEAMWYYESSDSVWIYVSPFIIVLGLIGNVLAGIVFLTKGHRKSAIHLCLLVLAIVDTSLLIFGLGFKWIYYTFHVDVRAMSDAGCQFHVGLVYFLVHFEAWILVTVTIERYIAVAYPFQAKLWCRRRNLAIALAVEFAVLFFINLHVYWTMELVLWEDGEILCELREDMMYFVTSVWPWIDLVLSLFVPFLLMLIFNTIICYKLYHHRRLQRRLSTTSVSMTQSRTVMLLNVTFTFLLLEAPIAVYIGLLNGGHLIFETQLHDAKYSFAWVIVNMLAYSNYSVNFFLYCVSSVSFRGDLKAVCCRAPKTPHTPNISTKTVSDSTTSLGSQETTVSYTTANENSSVTENANGEISPETD